MEWCRHTDSSDLTFTFQVCCLVYKLWMILTNASSFWQTYTNKNHCSLSKLGKNSNEWHTVSVLPVKEVVQTHSMLDSMIEVFLFCSYSFAIYFLVISTSLGTLFIIVQVYFFSYDSCSRYSFLALPFFLFLSVWFKLLYRSHCVGNIFTLTSPADNLWYRF